MKRGTLNGLRGIPLVSSQMSRKKIFLYWASGAERFVISFLKVFAFLLSSLPQARLCEVQGPKKHDKGEKGCGVIAREALPHSHLSQEKQMRSEWQVLS